MLPKLEILIVDDNLIENINVDTLKKYDKLILTTVSFRFLKYMHVQNRIYNQYKQTTLSLDSKI